PPDSAMVKWPRAAMALSAAETIASAATWATDRVSGRILSSGMVGSSISTTETPRAPIRRHEFIGCGRPPASRFIRRQRRRIGALPQRQVRIEKLPGQYELSAARVQGRLAQQRTERQSFGSSRHNRILDRVAVVEAATVRLQAPRGIRGLGLQRE